MAVINDDNWSVLDYRPSDDVMSAVSETLSIEFDQISQLDFEDELALVARVRGSKPEFPDGLDFQQLTRGNVSLTNNWISTPDDIERDLRMMDEYYARELSEA